MADKLQGTGKLAGLSEASALLGVSKRSVWSYHTRRLEADSKQVTRARQLFPVPVDYLAGCGPVWKASDLVKWRDTYMVEVEVTLPNGKKHMAWTLPPGRPPKKKRGNRGE